MQNYTEEEAAILCGFIGRYVDRDSTYDTVRSGYSRMCRGLEQHALTHQDYLWTEQVLQFLKPQWWTERENHRAGSYTAARPLLIFRRIQRAPNHGSNHCNLPWCGSLPQL